jgi:ketosteroid isomerase-like protein
MAGTDAKTIASKCLEAWSSADFDTARALFADDVTFVGPMGQTEGVDAYIEGVRGLKEIVSGTEQQLVFGEGENVCIIYDLVTTTPAGSIPCAGWYRVRDGKITSVRAFFDARPLTQ